MQENKLYSCQNNELCAVVINLHENKLFMCLITACLKLLMWTTDILYFIVVLIRAATNEYFDYLFI